MHGRASWRRVGDDASWENQPFPSWEMFRSFLPRPNVGMMNVFRNRAAARKRAQRWGSDFGPKWPLPVCFYNPPTLP